MTKVISKDRFTKIKYRDAHYSYKEIVSPPEMVLSTVKLLREESEYVVLECAHEDPHSKVFGLVVPKAVISGMDTGRPNFKANAYSVNDTIAVYWLDILAYDLKYTGKIMPTPMLTEGVLIKETDEYIIVDNPETLNLMNSTNHPQVKPKRCYIPKAMITEIAVLRK